MNAMWRYMHALDELSDREGEAYFKRVNPLETFSNEQFENRYRLSKTSTEELIDMLNPYLERRTKR